MESWDKMGPLLLDVFVLWGILLSILPLASTYNCHIENGKEPNYEDYACESYWTCEDSVGTLTLCNGADQFDFSRLECQGNSEVWCQFQHQQLQESGSGVKQLQESGSGVKQLQDSDVQAKQKDQPVTSKPKVRHIHHVIRPRKGKGQGGQDVKVVAVEEANTDDQTQNNPHSGSYDRPHKNVYEHARTGTHEQNLRSNAHPSSHWSSADHVGRPSAGEGPSAGQKHDSKTFTTSIDYTYDGSTHTDNKKMQHPADSSSNYHSDVDATGHNVHNSKSKMLGMDYDVTKLVSGSDHQNSIANTANTDYDYNNDYEDIKGWNYVCMSKFGHEPHLDDPGCKSFWRCDYYKGSLITCKSGNQYDFHAKACRDDQYVNCQGQMSSYKDSGPNHRTKIEKGKDGMTIVHHYYHEGYEPPEGTPDVVYTTDEHDYVDQDKYPSDDAGDSHEDKNMYENLAVLPLASSPRFPSDASRSDVLGNLDIIQSELSPLSGLGAMFVSTRQRNAQRLIRNRSGRVRLVGVPGTAPGIAIANRIGQLPPNALAAKEGPGPTVQTSPFSSSNNDSRHRFYNASIESDNDTSNSSRNIFVMSQLKNDSLLNESSKTNSFKHVQAETWAPQPQSVQSAKTRTPQPQSIQSTETWMPQPQSVQSTETRSPQPQNVQSAETRTPQPQNVQSAETRSPQPQSVQSAETRTPQPQNVQSAETWTPQPQSVQSAETRRPLPQSAQSTTDTAVYSPDQLLNGANSLNHSWNEILASDKNVQTFRTSQTLPFSSTQSSKDKNVFQPLWTQRFGAPTTAGVTDRQDVGNSDTSSNHN